MKFSSYLDPQFIFTDLKGKTPEEIITEMIERLSLKDKKINELKDVIVKSVIKREEEISTGMGNGIAIPHARIENFNDFIVSIGILEEPIEVEIAATRKTDKVKLVFLIISDVLKNKNILKVMSAVSKMALKRKNLLEKIKEEKNPNKIVEYIQESNIEIDHRIIAEDVLSPDIEPATPENTLEEIAKRLILEQISGLPVVDKDGMFLGEITERELIDFGMPDYLSLMGDLNFLTVGEPFEEYLVNETTTTIEKLYRVDERVKIDRKTPIMEICFIMVNKGLTRLYVLDEGKYYGMIRRSDIIKKVLHI
ncbi:PTS sugar transporter subunit IIA [Fusobacterium varium]|uniref:PTS sugar transporter subunit IIA n=1 Tax=Fusobacterium varium TaxID=856 RepID=UPI000BBA7F16|nr:PTS sugar transporter subunit IIA [uncultured Fusobacterium sp.]BBA50153.1 putative PTS sugar transporter [Fusobacterium varium]